MNALPPIEDEAERQRFEALRQELNALPRIDYERVNNAKTEYLQILYGQEGKKVLASAEFKRFFDEAGLWLVPYAQYCYLREKYGTADFSRWPDHNHFDESERKALSGQRNVAFKKRGLLLLRTVHPEHPDVRSTRLRARKRRNTQGRHSYRR